MQSPIRPLLTLEILLVLGTVLFASAMTFAILVRRWTTQRHRVAMTDWGRQRGFELQTSADVSRLGPPLDLLKQYAAQPAICLDDGRTRLVEVAADPPARSDGRPGTGQITWRLVIRRIEPSLRTAGLRPVHDRHSFLDLFSLSSFPTIGGTERFILFAGNSEAAREFPAHAFRSMTPQDVGVFIYKDALVLDFSSRPFDDLEFNRMTGLADQLAKIIKEPGK
ncbi:MAG TPA: hypothetical protein VIM11_18980 [Tepidisphaeraceae bacterium]|jgi:hypothetical protein